MFLRLFLSLLFFLLLGGCGFFNKEEGGGTSGSPLRELSITLVDDEGSPVSPAFLTVKVDRDGDGSFGKGELFTGISDPLGRVKVKLPAELFSFPAVIEVRAGGFPRLERRVSRLSDYPFSISLPGMVEASVEEGEKGLTVKGERVEIEIPYGKVSDSSLRARLYYLNPALSPRRMPGGFFGYDGEGMVLSTAGAFEVEFYSSGGARRELGSGSYRVTVKVPPELLAGIVDVEPSTPQVEVPLWFFDTERGVWRRYENPGVVVDGEGNPVGLEELRLAAEEGRELFVKGEVEHFSWLNVDVGGSITVISGRLKRIPKICLIPGTRCFVAACGDNWRGHTSSYISKDGYFSLAVPVDDSFSGRPVADVDKALDGLGRIAGKFLLDPSLLTSDVCESERVLLKELLLNEIEAIRRINRKYYEASQVGAQGFFNAIYASSTGTGNVAKQTYDTINSRLDKAEELLSRGELEGAFKAIEDINRIYGENLTAEALNAYAKELQRVSLNTIFSGLVDGLSAVDKCMLHSLNLVEKNTKFAACISGGLQSGIKLRNLYSDFSSAYQGVKDKDFMTVASSSIAAFGVGLSYGEGGKYWDILGDFTDLAKGCLRGAGLENVAADCAKASLIAKRIAIWSTFFADVGYGLIEVSDANYRARGALFSSRLNSEIGAFRLRLKAFLKKLKEEGYSLECLDIDNLLDEFSDLKEGEKFYSQDCPPGSGREEIEVPEPSDGDYLNELFRAIWEENLALSSPYRKYYSVKGGSFEELPTLPADVDTFLSDLFNGNGRYLSRLYLYVESPVGVFRKPINTVTDQGIPTWEIPSPPFGGVLFPDDYLSGWIGEVELPEDFIEVKTVPLRLNISLEGGEFSIEKLMGYVAVKKPGGGWLTAGGYNLELACSVNGSSALCSFEVPEEYFVGGSLDLRIYPGFILKHSSGKRFKYYPGLRELSVEEEAGEVELTFAPRGVYYVKSVEVESPPVVEPLKEYRLKADVRLEVYGVRSPGQAEITWYFNHEEIGKGRELVWRSPDRHTLLSLSSQVNGFVVKACYRNNCTYSFEPVEVAVPNSPPEVELLGPRVIASNQESASFRAEVRDPDGDPLSFVWYTTGAGKVRAKGDSASVGFRHLSRDYAEKVCVAVSDGLSEVVKCREVNVERALPPPKVRDVDFNLSGTFAPQKVSFKVSASAPLGHGITGYLFDFDGDGRWDFEGSSPVAEHTFLSAGNYNVRVAVRDDLGRLSEPYTLTLSFKEFDFSGLSVRVSVVGLKEDFVEVRAVVEGLGSSGLKYYWDFNGDGDWDEVSTSPVSTFTLPLSLLEGSSKLRLSISSLLGRVERELPVTAVEPFVELTPSTDSGYAPLTVNFKLSVVSPGRKVKEYRFDFDGDGEVDLTTDNPEASHTYSRPGEYLVRVEVLFNDGALSATEVGLRVLSANSNNLVIHLPSGGFPVVLLDGSMEMAGWVPSDDDGTARFEQVYAPLNFEVVFYPGVRANGSMVLASVLHKAKVNKCSINYSQVVKERKISLSDFYLFVRCSYLTSLFSGNPAGDYDSDGDGFLSESELLNLFTAVFDGTKNPALPDNAENGTLEVGELYGEYLSLKRFPDNGTAVKVFAVKGAPAGEYYFSSELLLPPELIMPRRAVSVDFSSEEECGRLVLSYGNTVAYRSFERGDTLKELLFLYNPSPYNLYAFYIPEPSCGDSIKAVSYGSLTEDSLTFTPGVLKGVERVGLRLSDLDAVNVDIVDSMGTQVSYRDWSNPRELLLPADFTGEAYVRLTKEGSSGFTQFLVPYSGGEIDDSDYEFSLSASVGADGCSFSGGDAPYLDALVYSYHASCRFSTGELSEVDFKLLQLSTGEPIGKFKPVLPDEVKRVLNLLSQNTSWEDESFGGVDLLGSFSDREVVEHFLSSSFTPMRSYWVK